MNKRQKKKQIYKDLLLYPYDYRASKRINRFLENHRSKNYGRWRTINKTHYRMFLSEKHKRLSKEME